MRSTVSTSIRRSCRSSRASPALNTPTSSRRKPSGCKHATAPVEFVAALSNTNAELYLQVGPGNALLSFARANGGSAFLQTDSVSGLLETLGQLYLRGIAVDARGLTPKAEQTLVSLPPTPLETQKVLGVERTNRVPHVPANRSTENQRSRHGHPRRAVPKNRWPCCRGNRKSSRRRPQHCRHLAVACRTVEMPAVVAAPVSQVVIKTPDFSNLVAQKPGAAPSKPVVVEAPKVDVRPDVEAKIFASVARISAFPQNTLKAEQSLTGELGFDSLMLVELDTDVAKAWPVLGGLPRELFTAKTQILDVVNHVVNALGAKSKPAV